MRTSDMTGAMADPCPVCMLKPVKAINITGASPEPHDGAVTVCFGCGLVQIIRGGMRCALTEEEADHLFSHRELIEHIAVIAKLRSMQPFRTQELVREQMEPGVDKG